MALNKYMHPRNLYKTPPDFAKLAKNFEEFSKISKTDVTGKVTIDFRNPHSLRILTKCLLKSDFGLDINIPEDRLVPTLPLRLNYILWIEDLIDSIGRKEDIFGLDIGTGACAIYPILAAVKNKWHMVGTESDQESLQKANENIEKNNLKEFIQLKKNSTSTLIEFLFSEENAQTFDFCMCNPPFYSNLQELCESRSPARLPPKNGFTGSPQELITEGGELYFCRKIIKESKVYKDKVLIFSTMVGHKYNLKELVQDLKLYGIKHTTTEFCQGRVTRWGLAWTFQNIELVPGRDKPRKKNVPVTYLLPELQGCPENLESISKKFQNLLQNLKIRYKILTKKGNQLCLDMKAVENTWSNQRRKRRLMKLQQVEAKKSKLNQNSETIDRVASSHDDTETNHTDSGIEKLAILKHEKASKSDDNCCSDHNHNENKNEDNEEIPAKSTTFIQQPITNSNISAENPQLSQRKELSSNLEVKKKSVAEILVHAFIKVSKKDKDILFEMEFLDGSAGKEGLHQIMQYIKNNWK